MKLIRSLVFPWIVFFIAALAGLVLIGVKFTKIHLTVQQLYFALGAGSALCLLANMSTLGSVGIWMSESLPESLRYGSWRWIFRAVKAVVIAAAFWFVGQLPWVPLVWQAAVMPSVFTIALFVAIWSLEGPILKFSSNMAWNRAFSIVLSLPVLAAVPVTALFLSTTMISAYRSSQPELIVAVEPPPVADESLASSGSGKKGTAAKGAKRPVAAAAPLVDATKKPAEKKLDKRAQALRDWAEAGLSCADHDKEIQAALEPRGPEDLVFWGVKAVGCSEIRAVIAMPRLAAIMVDHPVPTVRAAAIRAMKKYGIENTRQISYLLVKRLSEREPKEVIEAAAAALAPLGADEQKIAVKRLKGLLDSKESSVVAAKSLMETYRRDDLVAEYVGQNLTAPEPARKNAIAMICLLPKEQRSVAEPHIDAVVASINGADPVDPGIQALGCLGTTGLKAIRDEVNHPRKLDRTVAARALAELNYKDAPEALETADSCSRDENEQVRQWCSRALGQIGAAALPKILDLLKSGEAPLKAAGQNALQYFDDVTAKDELLKIRADNSGWMANNKKLQIAKAVGLALLKIQGEKPAEPTGSSGSGNGTSNGSTPTIKSSTH